jgi:hypothetical protein
MSTSSKPQFSIPIKDMVIPLEKLRLPNLSTRKVHPFWGYVAEEFLQEATITAVNQENP